MTDSPDSSPWRLDLPSYEASSVNAESAAAWQQRSVGDSWYDVRLALHCVMLSNQYYFLLMSLEDS